MVENIVERVTIAVREADTIWVSRKWPELSQAEIVAVIEEAASLGGYQVIARAAILETLQAMREPTPEALAAAWAEITKDKQRAGIARLGPGPGASDWWRAMIDAAIKELEEAG